MSEVIHNVFISQPMRGLTSEQIVDRRQYIVELIKRRYGDDVNIIDSIIRKPPTGCNSAIDCLGTSLQLMSTADLVVFDVGYECARGCRIEHQVARDYGLAIAYVDQLM